jgi:hypothetical protein
VYFLTLQRRVDLGLLNLDTVTAATFTVNNTSDQLQVRYHATLLNAKDIAMHVPLVLMWLHCHLISLQEYLLLHDCAPPCTSSTDTAVHCVYYACQADPVKYVVMLLTKPSANVLTVTNNSTGSLAPRGSQEVSAASQ